MSSPGTPVQTLRAVIDANRYLVLATADDDGTPWATPVYYAADRYVDFYWVSSPDARHSRSIRSRSAVGIVIFDSHAPVGGAEAVYMDARAAQIPADQLAPCLPLLEGSALEEFGRSDLVGDTPFRLYRAHAVEHSLLLRGNESGSAGGADSRVPVTL